MLARNRPILSTTVTGAATYRTPVVWLDGQSNCSLQCQAIGTAVGTSIKVYGSNIYSEADGKTLAQSITDKEWVEVVLTYAGATSLPIGADWTELVRLPYQDVPFACIFLEYVNASGTSVFKTFFTGR